MVERATPAMSRTTPSHLRQDRLFIASMRSSLAILLRRYEPAHDLFNHVAHAVIGRTLHDDERELWKDLVEMFDKRNDMAHRADEPTVERARELVWAGRRVFAWLNNE
jgi:hypothetical protein